MIHLYVHRRYGTVVLPQILCTGIILSTGRTVDVNLTDQPHTATCPTCRDRYETEPQPATTKDLAEVLGFLDEVVMETANCENAATDYLRGLRQRMDARRAAFERPRPIKEPEKKE